jgi:hypothetical protein
MDQAAYTRIETGNVVTTPLAHFFKRWPLINYSTFTNDLLVHPLKRSFAASDRTRFGHIRWVSQDNLIRVLHVFAR